ncbi:MAG: chromate transporter [Sedimentisphaerales bacterium]|nr:chromate transporter [Sedimentisphaerales bacterium]
MAKLDDGAKNPVSLAQLFWVFFRIGLFTLGGGLAMATVMRHELVLRRRWIEDAEFMAQMSTATVVPGAIAVNMAYLQGRRLRGRAGAAAAILGTVLPSFCVILLLAWIGLPYFKHPRVAAFLKGCVVAVAGQLAFAGFTFGKRLLCDGRNIVVCLAGLTVVGVLPVHPVWAILVAGGLGYWICRGDTPSDRLDDRG